MTRLIWSPEAQHDVRDIANFLLTRNRGAAKTVVQSIRSRADSLREHPRLGEPLGVFDLRKLTIPIYPYVLVYRVVADNIEIVRVRHTSEDWRPR